VPPLSIMNDPSRGEPSPRITIDREALKALRAELYKERGARDALQRQLNRETEFSRRAAEETLAARDDRDTFRRLMAVGLANEQNAVGALSQEREKVVQLEHELAEAVRDQGKALGRALELEGRIADLKGEHLTALRAAKTSLEIEEQRAQETSERLRENTEQLTRELGHAQGTASELRVQIPAPEEPALRVARARANACWAAASICGLLGLILLPAVLLSLFSGQRPEYLRLAIGMPPGVLLLLETGFLAAAYLLSTHALRELRGLDPAPEQSTP